MLTFPEKILFALAVAASLYGAARGAWRIIHIIQRGKGKVDWKLPFEHALSILPRVAILQPIFRLRLLSSLFHALIVWGFLFFLLVNLGDLLYGYIPDFHLLGRGVMGNVYRLLADIASLSVLTGMAAMLIRRFVLRSTALATRREVLLHPKARQGIRRDSAIVGGFVLIHVGSRLLGASTLVAASAGDAWQPFASILSRLWSGSNHTSLVVIDHLFFWLSFGTILAFVPYFLYSKHVHLFFAPLNFLLKPERRSIGELARLNFEDESIEQFGAARLEDLGWEQIMDAYACIQCYRCQQVCPAYNTGKVLSPAALEINKRYFLNEAGAKIARGEESPQTLVQFAIPPEAVWACTACAACIDICPVNNEPMRDILDIRRNLVLMENDFPDQLQAAFKGMERNANPWNISSRDRMKWAEGLDVPTIDQNPQPNVLWWVGCAPATDPRAQKTAQAFAKILQAARVNFAVLGEREQCTGDSARRAGNEFLFNELATTNVETLNEVAPRRIVTTCPHCLHTLKNEYPAFGGNYTVIHHTQFIQELITEGRLRLVQQSTIDNPQSKITFHDPCYLGRHNRTIVSPRQVIQSAGHELVELPNHGRKSLCCGAGGAQMWKEEEPGEQRLSARRFGEVQASGAQTLAVACPFCMIMLTDAKKAANSEVQVLDIAELIVNQLDV